METRPYNEIQYTNVHVRMCRASSSTDKGLWVSLLIWGMVLRCAGTIKSGLRLDQIQQI